MNKVKIFLFFLFISFFAILNVKAADVSYQCECDVVEGANGELTYQCQDFDETTIKEQLTAKCPAPSTLGEIMYYCGIHGNQSEFSNLNAACARGIAEGKKAGLKAGDSLPVMGVAYCNVKSNGGSSDGSSDNCQGLLGEKVLNDLKAILKMMRIIGPLIVIGLTTMEFITAITNKNEDALKKSLNKLITRVVLVIILFFLPILLNFILGLIDTRYSTCVD